MANPPRTRNMIHAIRRAPDGSAFQKCHNCCVSVAIALADVHECIFKKDVKRFKGECGRQNIMKQSFDDQPISPFRLFMESFMKSCTTANPIDVDRKGFETWKNMSQEERRTFVLQAEKVNSAYDEALVEEVDDISEVDDEADSAMVGKLDLNYEYYEYYEYSDSFDSFDSFRSRRIKSFNTYQREMVRSCIA